MNKIKSLFSGIKNNRVVTVCTATALTLGTTVITHAADGTADSDVVSAFTTMAGNAAATVKGVALVGVGIMTVFIVWKYGKKIFNRVAN